MEDDNSTSDDPVLLSLSEQTNTPTPTINPSDLLGYKFVEPHEGVHQRGEVTEQYDDELFRVKHTDGGEDIKTYNDLINLINRTKDTGHDLWSFNEILGHRREKRGTSVKWKLHAIYCGIMGRVLGNLYLPSVIPIQ